MLTFLYIDHIDDNGVDIDMYLGLVKQYDNMMIQILKNYSRTYYSYLPKLEMETVTACFQTVMYRIRTRYESC
jgi:hypothetical protein